MSSVPLGSESIPVTSSEISLRIISDFTEWVSLKPEWLDLLHRSCANEPMLAPHWLLPWWHIYGTTGGRTLRLGLFYHGDRLIGLVPLQRRTVRHRLGVPMTRLEFVGADVDEGDGVCSEYLNLIAERGREADIVTAFVQALGEDRFGRWHELVLSALDGDNLMPGLLRDALATAGLGTERSETTSACYIPLPESWQAYLTALGKHRRYVNKTLRDFETWAEGTAAFHHAETLEQLAEGKRILHELHGQRWQENGQSGVFDSPRFSAFHEQVMDRLWQAGLLDLYWLTAHDRPLAAVYNIRWNNKVYFYQSGRQMDLPKSVRVGIVLHAHCIQEAIAAGCREYDFLGGPTQYKQQLSPSARPIVQIRAVRPSWRERLRRGVETGVDAVRQLRNRIRSFRQKR